MQEPFIPYVLALNPLLIRVEMHGGAVAVRASVATVKWMSSTPRVPASVANPKDHMEG